MERPERDPPFPYRPRWYPHPERPEEMWYWDGERWTDSRPWTRDASQTDRESAPRPSRRARFRVAFDGSWQEDFETLTEALEWAREVSDTGRITYVIEWRGFLRGGHRFRAGFPEERAREAEQAWLYWRNRGFTGMSGG